VVQIEELSAAGFTGIGYGLHSEIVSPYLLHYGTTEQKRRYLPLLSSGDMVGAIAMTEPSAGSDLQGIQSTALQQPDGSFLLNGSKTYITNGWHSDLVIVVAKTQPSAGAKGTSLFLLTADTPGFTKGKPLHKMGLKAQDTCELFFDNVRLPAGSLLGGLDYLNRGFICLMEQLPWERLQIAIGAVAASQAAIEWTLDFVKQRKVFGQSVATFQNTRFTLAELQTEVQIAQVFVDKCSELLLQDKLDTATASMAKYWTTDLQCKVMDECVQLHGGSGYMWEYPITRAYADARVQRIYGGTNEIMKEVITRSMGLGTK
jgi:acyl-CoA dehydrogenase